MTKEEQQKHEAIRRADGYQRTLDFIEKHLDEALDKTLGLNSPQARRIIEKIEELLANKRD